MSPAIEAGGAERSGPSPQHSYRREEILDLLGPLFAHISTAYFAHINGDEDASRYPEDRDMVLNHAMHAVRDCMDAVETLLEMPVDIPADASHAARRLMVAGDLDFANAHLPARIPKKQVMELFIGMDARHAVIFFANLRALATGYQAVNAALPLKTKPENNAHQL